MRVGGRDEARGLRRRVVHEATADIDPRVPPTGRDVAEVGLQPEVGEQPVVRAVRRHDGTCHGQRQRAARFVIAERARRQAALDQRAFRGLLRVGLVGEEPVALEDVVGLRRRLVVTAEVLLDQRGRRRCGAAGGWRSVLGLDDRRIVGDGRGLVRRLGLRRSVAREQPERHDGDAGVEPPHRHTEFRPNDPAMFGVVMALFQTFGLWQLAHPVMVRVIDAAGAARSLRVVVMAALALRRDAREVAVLVAVGARDRAVQAGQVAADLGVIEARRRERPLRVALTAARR